jgi:hypothetical protein
MSMPSHTVYDCSGVVRGLAGSVSNLGIIASASDLPLLPLVFRLSPSDLHGLLRVLACEICTFRWTHLCNAFLSDNRHSIPD